MKPIMELGILEGADSQAHEAGRAQASLVWPGARPNPPMQLATDTFSKGRSLHLCAGIKHQTIVVVSPGG